MHPFPKQEDLAYLLVGDPILQSLAIWPYALTIGLDNGCAINAAHTLTYVNSSGDAAVYGAEWRNEASIAFHELLEQRLVGLERTDRELALIFEKGGRLIVHSDLGIYEAGQIHGPNGSLEVF